MNNVKIVLQENEIQYLRELLNEEVFNLQGVVRVSNREDIGKILSVAETLQQKIVAPPALC